MRATVECRGEEVAERLEGESFGSTRVERARSTVDRDDEDELATYLDLVLNDPAGDTWPLEEILELRRTALRVAGEVGLDTPVYVRLSPETDVPQEDDEPRHFPA